MFTNFFFSIYDGAQKNSSRSSTLNTQLAFTATSLLALCMLGTSAFVYHLYCVRALNRRKNNSHREELSKQYEDLWIDHAQAQEDFLERMNILNESFSRFVCEKQNIGPAIASRTRFFQAAPSLPRDLIDFIRTPHQKIRHHDSCEEVNELIEATTKRHREFINAAALYIEENQTRLNDLERQGEDRRLRI